MQSEETVWGKWKQCKLIFEVSTLAFLIHKKPNKLQLLAYARQQSYE